METGGLLVDVRSPEEYARGHLSGARNAPLNSLASDFQEPKGECLLLYCQSGLRTQRATQVLRNLGYSNVHNFSGMSRWERLQPAS